MKRLSEYSTLTDDELIKIIVEEKRHELFALLYERYQQKVFDKCYSMLKNTIIAGDLTEDVFVKVLEKIGGFRGSSLFSTWLYAITYNTCIDYLRKQKNLHYPKWNARHVIPEIIDEIVDEPEIDQEEMIKLLDLIHPEEKVLLLMKYQDNTPIRQIAAALRISESAAKMRIKRARARVLYLYNSSNRQ